MSFWLWRILARVLVTAVTFRRDPDGAASAESCWSGRVLANCIRCTACREWIVIRMKDVGTSVGGTRAQTRCRNPRCSSVVEFCPADVCLISEVRPSLMRRRHFTKAEYLARGK